MVCAPVRIRGGSRQGGGETRGCRRNLESTVPHPSLPGFRLQNLSVPSNGERPDPRFGYSGFQRPESFLAVALHQQCRPGRRHDIGGRSRHPCGRRMEAHGRQSRSHRRHRGRRGEIHSSGSGGQHVDQSEPFARIQEPGHSRMELRCRRFHFMGSEGRFGTRNARCGHGSRRQ